MPKLLHHPLDPLSRSIRLALAECEVEFELAEEKPWEWRNEFVTLNPAGTLPVYVMDDGEAISGAYPILEYLHETVLAEKETPPIFQLLPGDATGRAEVRRLIDWFHRKFNDEVSYYLLEEKVVRRFGPNSASPDTEAMRAGHENLRYHLSYIDFLAETRSWLAGELISFADLAAAAHLSALDYLGAVPWQDYEAVKNWYALLKSRPSFRPLLADRVAGFTPSVSYADPDF